MLASKIHDTIQDADPQTHMCCMCVSCYRLSQARLSEVQKELATLEDQLTPLLMKYKQEKERLDTIRRLQVCRAASIHK
jgi:hypothetical protein